MNEKLADFIKGLGALTEIWIIVYKNFVNQGLTPTDALEHTKELMSILTGHIITK